MKRIAFVFMMMLFLFTACAKSIVGPQEKRPFDRRTNVKSDTTAADQNR